jgi:hypothetical protein
MCAKKAQKNAFKSFFWFIILPLLGINGYAYWKLDGLANHWCLSIFDNPINNSFAQLAIILAINSAVILFMLAYIALTK